MDYISLLLSIMFSLGAAVCLCLSIFFFFHDKHKRGIALSTLMFVCALLAYVPQLDSIKSGFVDAKFNRTLNQANDIIARLTGMAVTSAKVGYTTLAWGGRMASPYAKDKQSILDEIDRQLIDLKVSNTDRREISKIFVNLVGVDLFLIYRGVMEQVVQEKVRQAQDKLTKEQNPEHQAAYEGAVHQSENWHSDLDRPYFVESFVLSDHLSIPSKMLDDREFGITKGFKDELVAMFNESAKKNGYSDQTAALVDKYRDETELAKKSREMFGATFQSGH